MYEVAQVVARRMSLKAGPLASAEVAFPTQTLPSLMKASWRSLHRVPFLECGTLNRMAFWK